MLVAAVSLCAVLLLSCHKSAQLLWNTVTSLCIPVCCFAQDKQVLCAQGQGCS